MRDYGARTKVLCKLDAPVIHAKQIILDHYPAFNIDGASGFASYCILHSQNLNRGWGDVFESTGPLGGGDDDDGWLGIAFRQLIFERLVDE